MRSRAGLQLLTSLPVKPHVIAGNCLTDRSFSEDKGLEEIEGYLQNSS
jgi:hypothetical protein